MAFLYIAALSNIIFNKASFIVIRGKALNTSNVGTKPSSLAVSLIALRAICSMLSFNRPGDFDLTIL